MTKLPASTSLPIANLSVCFNNVTNSYKFYWFLSVLEHIQFSQNRIIPIKNLIAGMIANIWYPINYFRIFFGKQDRLGLVAWQIRKETSLKTNSKKDDILNEIHNHISVSLGSTIERNVNSLSRYVPYRFLRPWFAEELRKRLDTQVNKLIIELAEKGFTDSRKFCLYKFVYNQEPCIEIQPNWYNYLQRHHYILMGFCLWHLTNYLQKRNPYVPNISSKLFPPEQRDMNKPRKFWRLVFNEMDTIRCIYSNQSMTQKEFSLDHFLPWRFVTHDLLWNIVPTPRIVNSIKSDYVPDIHMYFEKFAQLQYKAIKIVAKQKRYRILEDYTVLFKKSNIAEIESLHLNSFREVLYNTITPQIQVAKNMGFVTDWKY